MHYRVKDRLICRQCLRREGQTFEYVCEECEARAAAVLCLSCEQLLCHECDQKIHNKGKRAKHVTEALHLRRCPRGIIYIAEARPTLSVEHLLDHYFLRDVCLCPDELLVYSAHDMAGSALAIDLPCFLKDLVPYFGKKYPLLEAIVVVDCGSAPLRLEKEILADFDCLHLKIE